MKHRHRKLLISEAAEVKYLYSKGFSCRWLGEIYGVSRHVVLTIKNGITYKELNAINQTTPQP